MATKTVKVVLLVTVDSPRILRFSLASELTYETAGRICMVKRLGNDAPDPADRRAP